VKTPAAAQLIVALFNEDGKQMEERFLGEVISLSLN
jgi:hypothetical protein